MKPVTKLFRVLSRYVGACSGYPSKVRYILNWWRFEQAGHRGGIEKDVRFLGAPRLFFDERVTLRRGVIIGGNGVLRIGARTSINENTTICCTDRVEIGMDCMIAPRVYILDVDHSFDRRDLPIAQQGYKAQPVVIEDDVWVGTGVVITKGVRIGRGSVIGANSVVTRDVPPYAIVAGVPARVIKERSQ